MDLTSIKVHGPCNLQDPKIHIQKHSRKLHRVPSVNLHDLMGHFEYLYTTPCKWNRQIDKGKKR